MTDRTLSTEAGRRDLAPLPAPFIDRLERLRRVNRSRALHSIARNHGDRGRYGQTFSAERQRGLLEWAATQTDEDILEWRNTGPVMLRWIRDHQPVVAETSTTLAWTCLHGVDLRFTPRCYLCKPWPDDSPVWKVTSPGHVHEGEWCAMCVEHGRINAALEEPTP